MIPEEMADDVDIPEKDGEDARESATARRMRSISSDAALAEASSEAFCHTENVRAEMPMTMAVTSITSIRVNPPSLAVRVVLQGIFAEDGFM